MVKKSISDLIIELHQLARQQPDFKTNLAIQKIADDLAKIGNEQLENLLAGDTTIGNDKGYKVSSLESAEEFTKKRNYHYKDMGDCV